MKKQSQKTNFYTELEVLIKKYNFDNACFNGSIGKHYIEATLYSGWREIETARKKLKGKIPKGRHIANYNAFQHS